MVNDTTQLLCYSKFFNCKYKKKEQMQQHFPLIPDEAFLYFPTQKEVLEYKANQTRRIMFDGGVDFTSDEKRMIVKLKEDMRKKEKNNTIIGYTDNVLLRFLQATQFNNTNCIKALRQYKIWQDQNILITLTEQIQGLLKKGILYISGRDYRYRPIIIVNVGKILEIKPKEKLFFDTLGYFFQFAIDNCLIQGQVQNWVCIIDLGNASVFSLSGTLSDTIKFLSNNFRARVHRSYLINAPTSVNFLWGIVKGVMNQDQLKKLSLTGNKSLAQNDFVEINKSQVEKKYGGCKQNMTNFWPITPFQQNFKTQKSSEFSLISVEEYKKKYMNKELQYRKINTKYIHQKNSNFFGPGSIFSRKQKSSKISQRSIQSYNDKLTRSNISQNLHDINSQIPKQKYPPEVPVVAESFSFQEFIDSFVKRIFS